MSSRSPHAPVHAGFYMKTVSRTLVVPRGCRQKSKGLFNAGGGGADSLQVVIMESRGVVSHEDDVEPVVFQGVGDEFFAGCSASQDDDKPHGVRGLVEEVAQTLVKTFRASRGSGDDCCMGAVPLEGNPDDVRREVMLMVCQDEYRGTFGQIWFGALARDRT